MMYRLLEEGEVVQVGDEFLNDDCETWSKYPLGEGKSLAETWMLGEKWSSGFSKPFRRKINTQK